MDPLSSMPKRRPRGRRLGGGLGDLVDQFNRPGFFSSSSRAVGAAGLEQQDEQEDDQDQQKQATTDIHGLASYEVLPHAGEASSGRIPQGHQDASTVPHPFAASVRSRQSSESVGNCDRPVARAAATPGRLGEITYVIPSHRGRRNR